MDKMDEWRVIQKCPDYEINRRGEVRRIADGKQVKSKVQKNIYGAYVRAALYDRDGTCIPIQIHREVALAFVPNPEGKPYVHHLDGDKGNCNADNLAWVTGKEHANFHQKQKDGTP